MTPAQRKIRARIAAAAMWGRTPDRVARSAAARQASHFTRFADQVDPDRKLPAAELDRRVADLRREHMLRLALKSSKVRQTKAPGGGEAA